jgi:hypothetical protein
MSVALSSIARMAIDTHPAPRVTYVPGGPLGPAPGAESEPEPAPEPALQSEPEPDPGRPSPVALLDDAALWQPTEVLPAVVDVPDPEPEPSRWRDPGLALPPVDWAVPAFRLDDPELWEPLPIAIAAPVTPELEAEPAPEGEATALIEPEPELDPLSPPAFVLQTGDAWGWAEPWAFEATAEDEPPELGIEDGETRRRRGISPVLPVVVILIAAAVSVWTALPRSRAPRPHVKEVAEVILSPEASPYALRTIPSNYLQDYWKAAEEYGLGWTKLAAVGQIESDQGRSETPGVSTGTNTAGAAGPAQFLGTTWARFGVDADGRGPANPYDPADAITAMAAYLKASGAPENWRGALFTYNHSTAYVNAVLALSNRYSVQSSLNGT